MNTTLKIFISCLFFLFAVSCQKEKKLTSESAVSKLLDKANDSSLDIKTQEKYLDSAYVELSDNKNDTLTRFFYRKTTAGYYNLSIYDKALKSSRKVFNLAFDDKDTLDMARSLYNTADSYYAKSNTDSAFYYYTQSEKLYRELNDLSSLGEIVLYKAYIYYDYGEYVLCEAEAIKALRLLLNENKVVHLYNCYNLIATSLDGQNNNTEALKYYQNALEQVQYFKNEGYTDTDIAFYRATSYNNMGGVYVKMENYREAIRLYNEALKFANLKNDSPSLYAKLINNLAYANFQAGRYENLPNLFFRSLRIRDSLNNKSGIVASKINLAKYFAFRKDTTQAITYLKEAHTEANKIKSHFDILNSLKLLSNMDKHNSVFYSNRYIKVNDSLQEIAKLNRDKFARIEYETDKLEDEKEALIKKNSFTIGVSAVVLLFLAAIFIIYYLNSRNKKLLLIQQQQKANEEIYQLMFEQQSKIESARSEEKNRIAMELHDGILNNIYAVRLNLEFINKKADEESILKRKEYIKELQKVESEIRGVSHDLSRGDLFKGDKSFSAMLGFMITSQKNNFETAFDITIDDSLDWDAMTNVVKVNVYRIIQEGLQNINKYSEAKHAHVSVSKDGSAIAVTITDDGIGFDTGKAKGGIGLRNLKKRAAMLNGNFEVVSSVGNGTAIKVVFPA